MCGLRGNQKSFNKYIAKARFYAFACDAGLEVNTESCDAHFIGIEENGTVERHDGIQGIADLSVDKHGWKGVVTRVS